MNKLKIVGTMVDGQPVMVDEVANRPIQADDIVADDSGFYRVIGGHSLQIVLLPELPSDLLQADYVATTDDFLCGTGRV